MKEGDKVRDFTLQNTQLESVSLSDVVDNGKAVILFFPLAFSSVCTEEFCTVRDNMKLYKSLNANLIGISVDSSFILREFKKANNLPFLLLSDFNKEVSSQFGVLDEDYFGMKGAAKRSAFVINQNMIVEYAEILEDASNLPDFRTIQKAI